MRIRWLWGAVSALATTLALTAAPALGAGWAPPFVVSPDALDGQSPRAALATDGTAIVVWVDNADNALYAAIRPAGGAFGPRAKLSANGSVTGPRIVVDGAGNTLVVWRRTSAGVISIEAASRPAGGSFGAPVAVRSFLDAPTLLESNDLTSPDAAFGPDGTAAVIWHRTYSKQPDNPLPGEEKAYIEASLRPPGGTFGAPELVETLEGSDTEQIELDQPDIAFKPDGNLLAVWMREFEPAVASAMERNIESATRSVTGGYPKTPVFKDPGGDDRQDQPQLSVTPNDGIRVLWRQFLPSQVRAARGVNGGYTSAQGLDSGGVMSAPQIASGQGGAIAAWIKANSQLRAATAAPGLDFGGAASVSIPGTGTVRDLGLVSDPLGNAVAVWSRDGTGIGAAIGSPGGGLGSGVTISGAGVLVGDPAVAVDASGNALAVWSRDDGSSVEAAVYDSAPPRIASLQVPAQGAAGSALAMSVSATDAWSPFTVSWSFGDGGTASGTSTSHSYAAAGSYTVTVTVTDAAGNSASASGRVTVAAGGAAGGSVIFDRSAPDVSSFSLARKRFAVGSGPTALDAARPPRGTTFRYTLSEAATARILIERALPGRRVGKSCKRPTRRLRKKRRCTRYVAVGTLSRKAKAGANASPFSGRIGRKALRPDSYRATVIATDAAGNRSTARQATFTIVRFI